MTVRSNTADEVGVHHGFTGFVGLGLVHLAILR